MSKNKKNKQFLHTISFLFITFICLGTIGFIFFEPNVNAGYKKNITTQTTPKITKKTINLRLNKNINNSINKLINKSINNYTNTINIENDASLQKYLGKNHPLNNPKYIPPDLKNINQTYIINKAYRPKLRIPACTAFENLAKDFYHKFNKKLYLVSAYRTSEDQKKLQKRCKHNQCANTEESEHRIGLAIDIHVITKNHTIIKMNINNIYYKRLKNNAYKYGFHNSFSKKSTNIIQEPRHRRYLGINLATKLYKKNITFTEYYKSKNTNYLK